jgi:mRNA interferase YafQ
MRTIRTTGRFDRDFRRELAGVLGRKFDELLRETVVMLAADKPMTAPLSRPCALRQMGRLSRLSYPTRLVLIYRKPDDLSLELVRLGSHSELGL